MDFLFLLIPLLFLNLNPAAWRENLQNGNRTSFLIIQAIRFAAGVLYYLFIDYLLLVDQTVSGFVAYMALPLGILFIVDGFLLQGRNLVHGFTGVLVILFFFGATFIYPFTVYKDLYQIVDAQESNGKLENTDRNHIIVVPLQYAQYKGEKLLGQLNNYSFYDIGEYSIQKIDNQLYWVAPVEYGGYFASRKAQHVEAYLKISAEDMNATAELADGFKMKYIPSAYFGDHLYRRVRKQYPSLLLLEASFEPDENGKPYYAVSYGHYELYRRGSIVDGVILVDPENGEMKKYPKKDVPEFVDQIIPADVAYRHNIYYGEYKEGFMNRIFTHKGIHSPTQWDDGDEVVGIFSTDGRMQWFTDHTTLDNQSTSMVGFSMMDAKTGKLTYYTGAKGFLNGFAALEVVNKTFAKEAWSGVQPVLYSIYDQITWVVPVIDQNGLLRRIALVHGETGKIAYGENKKELFEVYKLMLATNQIQTNTIPTDLAVTKNVQGTVQRVSILPDGDMTVKLLLHGQDKIFNANGKLFPYAAFTQSGDQVLLEYIDNDEVETTVKGFENLSLKN
ncbi:hypothetical protein HNQ80_004938 [Anaerosolibacter carboniphilus]|uniref:Uncharacterized protein n=1 Tax=Anaerosolibacter carboniphilus TaxID=1417629 RepID=A0A841KZM7_9FIRM|nr:hypothetical protein [Anaerosolibacter carboniphilus]MBB6218763.1 hypothetical protein [Anaerosolibacter carboniphilus]